MVSVAGVANSEANGQLGKPREGRDVASWKARERLGHGERCVDAADCCHGGKKTGAG